MSQFEAKSDDAYQLPPELVAAVCKAMDARPDPDSTLSAHSATAQIKRRSK